MASIPSHAHIEIALNGYDITTFADDDPPYMIETDDSAEFKVGQDGKLYGLGRADFSGTLRIRLAPHSPAVQWCISRENERKQRLIDKVRHQTFNGTLVDVVNNIDYRLQGGAIQNLPAMTIANQTYEAVFRFERIISNVDSGAFAPRFNTEGTGGSTPGGTNFDEFGDGLFT